MGFIFSPDALKPFLSLGLLTCQMKLIIDPLSQRLEVYLFDWKESESKRTRFPIDNLFVNNRSVYDYGYHERRYKTNNLTLIYNKSETAMFEYELLRNETAHLNFKGFHLYFKGKTYN